MVAAYYNELDKHAAEWLRNLIREGLIADGDGDERPIQEVKPDDLSGYTQCHFFAGIGGWSYALRLARWPDERPVWTGSCPCQSFSVAGKREGASDSRHIWPDWFRLIEKCQPPTVFGEQVAGAVGFGWLDAVATDFESQDYAFGSAVLSGFAVGAHHKRQRLWFVADSQIVECDDGFSRNFAETHEKNGVRGKVGTGRSVDKKCLADSEDNRLQGRETAKREASKNLKDESESDIRGESGRYGEVNDIVADTNRTVGGCGRLEKQQEGRSVGQCAEDGSIDLADTNNTRSQGRLRGRSDEERQTVNRLLGCDSAVDWSAVEWVECHDKKTRPIPLEPNVQPLVDGIPSVLDREGNTHKYSYANALKGIGNAIIPEVAAEFINVYMDIALDGTT